MLEIKAMVADMLDLPFADETFDVVIEKGTMVRIKGLDFALSFVSANTYFVSLAFNLPSLDALVIQGCIVRGQW